LFSLLELWSQKLLFEPSEFVQDFFPLAAIQVLELGKGKLVDAEIVEKDLKVEFLDVLCFVPLQGLFQCQNFLMRKPLV
jgi:hypothetical protein